MSVVYSETPGLDVSHVGVFLRTAQGPGSTMPPRVNET